MQVRGTINEYRPLPIPSEYYRIRIYVLNI